MFDSVYRNTYIQKMILIFFFFLFIYSSNIYAQNLSIFLDLKPIYLSISAGGPGFGIGWELFLKNLFSLYGKFVYMNLYDAQIWLMYYLQGFRLYFNKDYFDKFFIGLYGIMLYGEKQNITSIAYGLQIDLGYKWRIDGFEKYYVEPQIGYIYFFGELPIIGFSIGLCVGIII